MKNIQKRHLIQWLLMPFSLIVIFFGWKYPLLGFLVPFVIAMGILGAFFNGRYVCGNLCPRGAFYDRLLAKISPKKPIPKFLKNMKFRLFVVVMFISLFVFRILKDPTNWKHWGHVFWFMCTVTTLIGILLGVFIHHRAWCSFCPSGTLENIIGGHKNPLQINHTTCADCRKCEKHCSMNLAIIDDKSKHFLGDRDCIKCGECIAVCPKKTLSFKSSITQKEAKFI